MKRKEFKLLIEEFNNFLIKGTDGTEDVLFKNIPAAFKDLVCAETAWRAGERWLARWDEWGYREPEYEADEKKLLLAVADEFGRDVNEILVSHHSFDDAWHSNQHLESKGYDRGVHHLIDNYIPPANPKHSPLTGKFVIDGETLDGFYYHTELRGSAEAIEKLNFINPRSAGEMTGMLYVVPPLQSQNSPTPASDSKETTKVFTAPAIINDTGAEVEDEEYH